MKKKLIRIFELITLVFVLIGFNAYAYEYDDTTVNIFVTVTDITDVNNPFNIKVPRTEIEVTNMDITKYGERFEGVELLDNGVTVFHAIAKLHEDLYGVDNVADKLKLDSDGITRVFMGDSVNSIVYKNGNDIFAYPQYVQVQNGDELNICLYNAGYSQSVASFADNYIYASPGENVELSLYEYYGYPRDDNPLEGQEIVDEHGIYVTDAEGNVIITDENGKAGVTLPLGEHKLSIMPKIDYFLSENGGETIIEWVENTVKHETYFENGALWHTDEPLPGEGYAVKLWEVFEEDEEWKTFSENADLCAIVSYNELFDGDTASYEDNREHIGDSNAKYTYCFEPGSSYMYEETVLEKIETFIPGEVSQMIRYTVPWCIVNVTDKPVFVDVKKPENSGTISARIKNAELYPDSKIICCLYDAEGGFLDSKVQDLKNYSVFRWSIDKEFASYKLLVVENLLTMKPICEAYDSATINPIIYDWKYTNAKPENLIIAGN